jgi:hypothetical protein
VKRSYYPDRPATDAERVRKHRARRQEADDAWTYAVWAGVLSGELTSPSGPSVPIIAGERVCDMGRVYEELPATLTTQQKLAGAALEKQKRPVAKDPTGVAQFEDAGGRFAQQRLAEHISAPDATPDADTWIGEEPLAPDNFDGRPLSEIAAESVVREGALEDRLLFEQARKRVHTGATTHKLTLKDGTKRRMVVALGGDVLQIAVTPQLTARALAALAREAALSATPAFGRLRCKFPLPPQTMPRDTQGGLISPQTRRHKYIDQIALAEKHTRAAVLGDDEALQFAADRRERDQYAQDSDKTAVRRLPEMRTIDPRRELEKQERMLLSAPDDQRALLPAPDDPIDQI